MPKINQFNEIMNFNTERVIKSIVENLNNAKQDIVTPKMGQAAKSALSSKNCLESGKKKCKKTQKESNRHHPKHVSFKLPALQSPTQGVKTD